MLILASLWQQHLPKNKKAGKVSGTKKEHLEEHVATN